MYFHEIVKNNYFVKCTYTSKLRMAANLEQTVIVC